uniref:Uncharacterized protein n=1 Tax=Anguilla anguilla TaxID=7936 RepID=A0A0E9VSW2_ANGAN
MCPLWTLCFWTGCCFCGHGFNIPAADILSIREAVLLLY